MRPLIYTADDDEDAGFISSLSDPTSTLVERFNVEYRSAPVNHSLRLRNGERKRQGYCVLSSTGTSGKPSAIGSQKDSTRKARMTTTVMALGMPSAS